VALKDDASTILKFSCGNCSWGLSFNFLIDLLTVITFPLILCFVNKNTLVQPVLPVAMRRNEPSSRTRRCPVNQGWGERSTPAPGSGRERWSLGQHGLFVPRHEALMPFTSSPKAKPLCIVLVARCSE